MSEFAEQVGFLGELDGDSLRVADSMGGGRQFDASEDRIVLIDEIADYIRDCAREMAESIVDDLVDEEEADTDVE